MKNIIIYSILACGIAVLFMTNAEAQRLNVHDKVKSDPITDGNFDVLEKKEVNGELIPSVQLNEVEVYIPRYSDPVEASRYNRLRRNVMIVYPYAKMAGQILEELDEELASIKRKRHQRRYTRQMQSELRDTFEAELRDLTVTQGKILVQLINRETGNDCYRLISQLRNPITARAWQTFAWVHGYDLKEPYNPEENPDLERIVQSLERTNFPTEISRK